MKNIYQFAAWIGSEIDGINDEKIYGCGVDPLCLDAQGSHRLHSAPGVSGDCERVNEKRTVCCGDLPAGGTLFHPSFLCI